MEIALSWVTSVVSFYTMFWTEPKGRHHLQLCVNLSCALRGADQLRAVIERRLGIGPKQRTADGRFSFEEVECLASCGTAPVMQVSNAAYHDSLDIPTLEALLYRVTSDCSPDPSQRTDWECQWVSRLPSRAPRPSSCCSSRSR